MSECQYCDSSVHIARQIKEIDSLKRELAEAKAALKKREDSCSKICMGYPVEGCASWVRLERLEAAESLAARYREALERSVEQAKEAHHRFVHAFKTKNKNLFDRAIGILEFIETPMELVKAALSDGKQEL